MSQALTATPDQTTHTLTTGLIASVETMPACRSVAVCLLLPMGLIYEPQDAPGTAALAEEWIFRGSQSLDNQAFNHALDRLGAQRHTHLDARYLQISAVCLNQQLGETLKLLADMVITPRLAPEEFPPVKALCEQGLQSLQDEPEERIGLLLRSAFQPAPFNRSPYGQTHGYAKATPETTAAFVNACTSPQGAILGIAGGIDADATLKQIEQTFGAWQAAPPSTIATTPAAGGVHHETDESQQTQICVAFKGPPENDPQTLGLKVALTCLSGGASGRLFTEVREKRGLCYTVSAGYAGDQERGGVFVYAGTTPQRAQETLDVMLDVTRGIESGVTADEVKRAKVTLLSRLVMQGESTEARASSLARDIGVFGKPRTLQDRADTLRELTVADVNQAAATLTQTPPTMATLGPQPLSLPKDWKH